MQVSLFVQATLVVCHAYKRRRILNRASHKQTFLRLCWAEQYRDFCQTNVNCNKNVESKQQASDFCEQLRSLNGSENTNEKIHWKKKASLLSTVSWGIGSYDSSLIDNCHVYWSCHAQKTFRCTYNVVHLTGWHCFMTEVIQATDRHFCTE